MIKMSEALKIKIGEEFKPSLQFRKLYYTYLFAAVLLVVLPFQVPLWFAPVEAVMAITLFVLIPALIVFIFASYWIPKYYESMLYKLTETEMDWKRGVWFRRTGIVPYNRITNIDIVQGPISRKLGIASLKIQTAGYSAASSQGGMSSTEITIEGVEQSEELRELIMEYVRGKKAVGVLGTFEKEKEGTKGEMLDELVRIRKALEKKKK